MSEESLEKAREFFNAGSSGLGDKVRQEKFKDLYSVKQEDLTDEEEQTINIISDLEETDFTSEQEQHALAEMLVGMASQNDEENAVATRYYELLDEAHSDIAEAIQDEFEIDIDQPEFEESTKHEATMAELEPGYQVIFRSGQYEGFTGTVQKVGVGERFEHISVELHQEHPHGDTAYVTPDEVEILTDGSQGTDMDMGNGVDEMPLVGEDSGSKYHDAKKQAQEEIEEETDDDSDDE